MTNLLDKLTKPVILDGSMSTPLEAMGEETSSDLWTAKALVDHPDRVYQVHYDYFKAGARITITDSYQANLPAFAKYGYSEDEARDLIKKSAEIAIQARGDYEQATGVHNYVAGSVGPYGAYLADGNEYRGNYHLTPEEYVNFHAPRIDELVQGGADCLAIETQPKLEEVLAILDYVQKTYPALDVYVSFSLKDPQTISEGTSLTEAAQAVQKYPQVFATGVNCMKLKWTVDAIKSLKGVTDSIIVYPNSGAEYDPQVKKWVYPPDAPDFSQAGPDWVKAGASIVGGCCTVMPADIQKLAEAVKKETNQEENN